MADKADWRINEKFRKPRQSKGTPLYRQRNYFAIAGIAFGAVSWYLYNLWPQSQKLRQSIIEGKFDMPDGLKLKIEHVQASLRGGGVEELLAKAREKEIEKHAPEDPEEQSWLSKITRSSPSL